MGLFKQTRAFYNLSKQIGVSLNDDEIIIPSRFTSVFTVRASMENDPPKKRVVVCGGGVIGVCTAYFLSKKGAAVTY